MKPEANEGSGMGELTPSFEGREVRTKKVASEHWFNAGDLAEAAGKRRDYAANWLRTAEASEYISLASSKLQNCNLVPEGGLIERIHGGDSTIHADDRQARVARLCRDATFHAIRGLNEINNQSQRLWSEFDVDDCQYHLRVAIEYLTQIKQTISRVGGGR